MEFWRIKCNQYLIVNIKHIKKPQDFSWGFVLVDYSDQKIESLVDEIEDFIDLFESTKKPQDFSWGHWYD